MSQIYKVGQTYFPKHPVKPSESKKSDTHSIESFNRLLEDKLKAVDSEIKFSIHAKKRLDQRGISLDTKEMNKLNEAVNKAAEKGVKDSLILMKDLAFVVNIPNKTIITTVDDSSMKEHIFTNIDGAIIL